MDAELDWLPPEAREDGDGFEYDDEPCAESWPSLDGAGLAALYELTPGDAPTTEGLADAFEHPRFGARLAVERVRLRTTGRPPLATRRCGPARRAPRRSGCAVAPAHGRPAD